MPKDQSDAAYASQSFPEQFGAVLGQSGTCDEAQRKCLEGLFDALAAAELEGDASRVARLRKKIGALSA